MISEAPAARRKFRMPSGNTADHGDKIEALDPLEESNLLRLAGCPRAV